MLNDYILSKEEQENIQAIAELNAIYDLMLGKPIPGEWLPWGPKRDPDTAEDPEVARKLLNQMENFHKMRDLAQKNEELSKYAEETIKQQFS